MPNARANGITIEYDTRGDSSARPLLLVMGLGAQMIAWDDAFVDRLVDRGHFVVRYDNRDCGLSTKFESFQGMTAPEAMAARLTGQPIKAPYLMKDMAADGIGLLDALGIEKAHVVGASMGGMIVQDMAIHFPERLLTMTSIMSTTGAPEIPLSTPEASAALLRPPATDRETAIRDAIDASRLISGPGFPFDEVAARERAARGYDRMYYPQGTARQLLAIVASGSRQEALGSVEVPTLVIHGADDPLVNVEGGRDTARSVPGAELIILERMGHNIPVQLAAEIVAAISRHTAKVAAFV